jgi:hypothetical protein
MNHGIQKYDFTPKCGDFRMLVIHIGSFLDTKGVHEMDCTGKDHLHVSNIEKNVSNQMIVNDCICIKPLLSNVFKHFAYQHV